MAIYNSLRMWQAISNKSWRQHPTKHQLYSHLPPIMKTIQVRRTRHVGHCWGSRDELISDVLLWTPHMAELKQDDQLEHTYSSCVRIRDIAQKTCQRRWTIVKSGERGSGISMLAARHDDDDDIYWTLAWWLQCSPRVRETRIQSQVESYQRLKKWYLMPPCLTLSIIRYGSRVKWSNLGKGVAPFPTPQYSSYRKGSLQATFD